jgi:DNA-binding CsgD family transcriptional regulator
MVVARALVPQVRQDLREIAARRLTWVDYTTAVADTLRPRIPFDAYCWHTVDPGTILFTGSVNRDVGCSGSWLAHYEYVVEDVNKWSFLAHSGRIAGAISVDTHGDPTRSPRHRSQEAFGFGDELRVSLLVDGVYWGAAAFLRHADQPWFTPAEVDAVRALSSALADGLRRSIVTQPASLSSDADHGPGVVVFDEHGEPESISPAAKRWISELIEDPVPTRPTESKVVQAVATRARTIPPGTDPLELAARARVRTRSGRWLLLYGTHLSGQPDGRTAVIIHPATPHDIAPVIATSYGLTDREVQVAMQCVAGRATKEIARALDLSRYTVQDHLKSIFDKTGVRSRGELVGQIFLDHYATRWEAPVVEPPGLTVRRIKTGRC